MNQTPNKKSENQEKTDEQPPTCPRCCGTGLVCGYKPEILPGACCVDYGNAICPECKGSGKSGSKGREK